MKIEYTKLSGPTPLLVLYRDTETSDTDECPFCGSNHSHGTNDGHRVAHCETGSKQSIVADDGTKLFQSDGYVICSRNNNTWKR